MKPLTIAIPTFNRNSTLLANLPLLLPQITHDCKLVIVDNCSDQPVAETLQDMWSQFPALDYEVIRNGANIGAPGNTVRCIELCQTPWVWVLGDDDLPLPGAVDTILAHIRQYPEAVLLNFSDGRRQQTLITKGLAELADKLDTSADLPWISTSVYRADALVKYLKFGYQYNYSTLPHVVMMLLAVGEAGSCCLARDQIVKREEVELAVEQQWSLVQFALGFPVILELPMPLDVRQTLIEKLLVTYHGDGFQMRYIVQQLLLMALKHGETRNTLYIFDQICVRRYYFDRRISARLTRFIYRMMLRFPFVTAALYRMIKGQQLVAQADKLQDRYSRL